MASNFGSTGPEVPIAPIEVPTPNLPPADFTTIGAQLAQGAKSVEGAAAGVSSVINWLADWVGTIVAALLTLVEKIIAWLLGLIFKVWNNAESGTDAIAAQAVSGIFRQPVSASAFQSLNDPSQRDAITGALLTTITNSLGAGFTGSSAQQIGPSTAGAEQFLKTALGMGIEGWLQGWIVEAFSLNYLERFGDLKDILERSLGIGRLSRQVLGPPMKMLVHDPLLWKLNQIYHPTRLPVSTAIREYIRGGLTQDQLNEYLDYAGIPAANIPGMVNEARPHLGVGELWDLVQGGFIDQPAAIQELQNAGWDNATAQWVWSAQTVARQKVLAEKYIEAAEALFIGRKMDTTTFNNIVDGFTNQGSVTFGGTAAGEGSTTTFGLLTVAEAQMIKATAFLRRASASQFIPLGQALQLLEGGFVGLDDYRRMLTLHGFSNGETTVEQWSADVDAAIDQVGGSPWLDWWELWAVKKSSDAAAAASARAASLQARQLAAQQRLAKAQAAAALLTATEEAKGVSIAKYETLVLDGYKTLADYQLFLKGKGLQADNIAAFSTVLQAKLAQKAAAAAATGGVTASSKAKALSVSQLQAAVKNNFLSIADYVAQLEALGYSAENAALLGEVLQAELAAAKLKASTSAAAAAALGERHVTLAEEERAVVLGLQTIDQYKAMLVANGFASEDVEILAGMAQAAAAAAQASAAKKAAAASSPGSKHLDLAQTERLVRAGQKTLADYQAALTNAGYDADSAASLVALLQLQLDYDKHQAAAVGRSSVLLTAGGLSLGQVRAAVKLGIVDISVYDAALTAAGVSSADAATLHASLLAEMAKTAATAAALKRVSAAVTASGTTLDALLQQVYAGTLSPGAFAQALTAVGVAAPDVAAFTALVTEQLADQAARAALVAGASAKAAAKGLNLAQAAAAVKAQVEPIDWYQAFVQSLGYDAADTAILVATEAKNLGISLPAAPATP
ncbi:MAG TPA: hypothetical protein VGR84_15425 [Candidatus Acidoferrales bacterium]|nr:hypothetical protein [Candidatus Acidoferrales bacterium]